jgi:hypothetical protein
MSALTSILIGAAAKVGAPLVKRILQDKLGGAAGELGGVIIDAIAGKAGVPTGELEALPAPQLESAVEAVEAETPEIIAAWNAQQAETNRLMLAEMQKETAFGWLWRPAGMWLMLGIVAWYIVILPLLNTALSAVGARQGVLMIVSFSEFMPVFMAFVGFYMGGNTLIRATGQKGKV